jgi:hypothetical protein
MVAWSLHPVDPSSSLSAAIFVGVTIFESNRSNRGIQANIDLACRFAKELTGLIISQIYSFREAIRLYRFKLFEKGNPIGFVFNAFGAADLKYKEEDYANYFNYIGFYRLWPTEQCLW